MFNKQNVLRVFLATIIIMMIGAGCKKYEDGPTISFVSKKNRLFGYWHLEKWIENGVEQEDELLFKHKHGFAKDGSYYYSFYDYPSGYTINFEGTWEFKQEKNQLVLGLEDPRRGMEYQVWDITRLTKKELWLERVSPEIYVEWRIAAD